MLNAPVLQLDAARMHEIDPRNVESLFGMWTVFSRCSNTIPNGKRLENLSWRVWARETLCCPPQPEKSIVPAIDVPQSSPSDIPSLSNSVASDDSDRDSISSQSSTSPRNSFSEHSALGKSRGNEPHLTPETLEKMVVNIKEKSELEPLSPAIEAVVNSKIQTEPPRLDQRQSNTSQKSDHRPSQYSTESSCISTMTTDTRGTERQSEHRNSDTSVSSDGLIRSGSVVHGFSPVPSSSLRSRSILNHGLPVLASKNATNKSLAPAKAGMFTLGGSSEDDESSFEQHMSFKRNLHEPRKSSLSQTFNKEPTASKKMTSFKDIVEQRRVQEASENDEGAIASSDEEDDDIDDSAIEEEDDGDWEDSNSDDDKPINQNVFKRIDSRANLTSRRSVLTAGLTESDRTKGFINAASKSSPAIRRATSHNGPSMPASPEKNEEDAGIMMQAPRGSRPMPIIATTSNTYAMAHSPRTTRRNMLSTELTESLRKNLLWERQQKSTTVNAFLKREARSMANLPKEGNKAVAPSRSMLKDQAKNNSFNEYFNVTNEYHAKGW